MARHGGGRRRRRPLLGFLTSFLILRGSDLTRLMVTLGVASILYELANKLDWLTGGADGLQGVVMGPLLTPFGAFEFDIGGRVACAYIAVSCSSPACSLVRRIVHSPFGFSLQALRDNRLRAASIGLSVHARLVVAYTHRRRRSPAWPGRCWRRPTASPRSTCSISTAAPRCCWCSSSAAPATSTAACSAPIAFKLLHDLLSAVDAAVLELLARPVPGRAGARRPRPAAAALDMAGGDEREQRSCSRRRGLVKRFGGITPTERRLAQDRGAAPATP